MVIEIWTGRESVVSYRIIYYFPDSKYEIDLSFLFN